MPGRGKALVKTGLAIALPPGTYGRVAPRSGLAWKHSLHTGAGVIDEDYRGEVGVILFNLSDEPFTSGCSCLVACSWLSFNSMRLLVSCCSCAR